MVKIEYEKVVMPFHCQIFAVSEEKGEQSEQASIVTQCSSFQHSLKTSHLSTQVSSSAVASHDISVSLLEWTPCLSTSLLAHELEESC